MGLNDNDKGASHNSLTAKKHSKEDMKNTVQATLAIFTCNGILCQLTDQLLLFLLKNTDRQKARYSSTGVPIYICSLPNTEKTFRST